MPRVSDDLLEDLQREVQRLFHDLVYSRRPIAHFTEPTWSPPADLVVSDREARVIVELAGVPRDLVRVRLRGNLLEVWGQRTSLPRLHGARYHRAEIYFGDFRRLIELPWVADESRVEARYRDGLLEIRMVPASRTEPRNVPVQTPDR